MHANDIHNQCISVLTWKLAPHYVRDEPWMTHGEKVAESEIDLIITDGIN